MGESDDKSIAHILEFAEVEQSTVFLPCVKRLPRCSRWYKVLQLQLFGAPEAHCSGIPQGQNLGQHKAAVSYLGLSV
jgi:hypothetical protein